MLRNYLTIAFRNLIRYKGFSTVTILGLSVGMTMMLLIGLWIQDEWQVDAFHKDSQHLYRVMTRAYPGDGRVEAYAHTQGLLYEELQRKVPEAVQACALSWETKTTFTVGDQTTMESGRFASEDFFRLFSFPLVQGTAATALSSPAGIVISADLACKYFKLPEAAIGKSLLVDNRKVFQVTAVFANTPENSSLRFDYVLPWVELLEYNPWLKD